MLFFVYFMKNLRWCLTTYASYKTKKNYFYILYIKISSNWHLTEQQQQKNQIEPPCIKHFWLILESYCFESHS